MRGWLRTDCITSLKSRTCQVSIRRRRELHGARCEANKTCQEAHGLRMTTVATFFDITRAFDIVWHGKLLDKLASLGIYGRL